MRNIKAHGPWCRHYAAVIVALFGCVVSMASAQDKKTAGTSKSSAKQESATQEVVADGVGATKSEAEKDAFRNAVKQVVGAVVDAETLVKNDEIIDDKVLTYSDGFVKKWETVSEKTQGGLVRVKIKAQVERRSVIAKLKAANVTMKAVDGKGLFAEVVTQLDAEQGTTAIVAKALADLPTLLTASVEGKPDYDRSTSEVVVKVAIETDQKAYKAFVTRLEETLQKVCLAKESVLLKGTVVKHPSQDLNDKITTPLSEARPPTGLSGPPIPAKYKNAWCLWVCSSTTGQHQNLRWNGYLLDGDASAVVAALIMPFVDPGYGDGRFARINGSKTKLKLIFSDADGSIVTEDETELAISSQEAYDQTLYPYVTGAELPLMRHAFLRNSKGTEVLGGGRFMNGLKDLEAWKKEAGAFGSDFTINAFVAPFTFTVRTSEGGTRGPDHLYYSPRRSVTRRLKMTLDELKQVNNVTCKIEFEADKK